jgi:prophage tail gpP-like protein
VQTPDPQQPDLRLLTGSTRYGGWKSIAITLGMEQCANGFELATSELWPDQETPLPISQDELVTIEIDDEEVITGWVDEIAPAYEPTDHQVSVKGRDVTGDLVDSSIVSDKQWTAKLDAIARDLCAPFKSVKVKVQKGVDLGKPMVDFKAALGDKVFEVLDRGAQQSGVLLFSDGLGNLVIGRASTDRYKVALKLGENIKSGHASSAFQDRFSLYKFVIDPMMADEVPASVAANTTGSAVDATVKRYRPYVKMAGNLSDAAALKKRAQWTANVHAARSCKATLTVQGWRNGDELWRPNKLVEIHDPFLKLDGDYLVSAVKLRLDAKEGFRTELEVTLPAAFSTNPVPAKGDITQLFG